MIIINVNADDEEEHKAMVKRQINSIPLVYPYGATYKVIITSTWKLEIIADCFTIVSCIDIKKWLY